MAFDRILAGRIRDVFVREPEVVEKKMFGGVAFLLNGNMLVGVWKDALIVRLSPVEGKAALLQPHVREFDITGRPLKGWIMVEPDGLEEDDELRCWIQRAIKFVEMLPGK